MADLDKKVNAMQNNLYSVGENLKKVSRRIDTLKLRREHSGNFKQYRKIKIRCNALYAEYEAVKKAGGFFAERKAEKALKAAGEYYEDNKPQLAMFGNAETYLRDVWQERFDPKKLPRLANGKRNLRNNSWSATGCTANTPPPKKKRKRLSGYNGT
jgi:hypothetical protein